jgi:mannose-6-phosphate isomerase-like protein (cupin superfamily)
LNQVRIYDLYLKDWSRIREDLTEQVYGKSLIPKDWSNVAISLTKVEPNGEFRNHIDSYHHVFYFMKGTGTGYINNEKYEIKPELIVEIPAGIDHGYKNTGKEDLFLLTINIPNKEIEKEKK